MVSALVKDDDSLVYFSRSLQGGSLLATQEALAARNVLFLWRNAPSVVVGRNQNPWHECDLRLLNQSNVKLARRVSGGGTVYHDLDNLNLTFLATRAAHAKEINSRVVAEALRDRYGLPVSVNDRNDLTLYDKKISGSAYKLGNKTAFHHCTLLVASDLDALGGTLRPTTSGISTKGIASVRSHVTNLNSHVPEGTSIQTDELDAAIAAAFLTEFGKRTGNTSGVGCSGSEGAGVPILDIATDGWAGTKDGEMAARRKEVQSWGWLFGQGPAFSFEQAKAFEWGLATIRLKMKRGHVIEAELIVTPGEHNLANVAEKLFGAAMLGSKFGQYSIINAVNQLVPTDPQANEAAAGVRADLIGWVKESLPVLLRVEEEETP